MRADIADVYPVVFRKEMDSVVSEFKMQAEYLIPGNGDLILGDIGDGSS